MKKIILIISSCITIISCSKSNDDNNNQSTVSGQVITLAGSETGQGNLDGTGTAAQFTNLKGICMDTSGNLFVTDDYNNNIRKVTQAGVVTTFAGSTTGEYGYQDATIGTNAKFNNPSGICIDTNNNLFVADYENHCIRKITPSGSVTTFCGIAETIADNDGTGTTAGFNYPSGICIDNQNIMYITEIIGRVRKVTQTAVVTTLAGTGLPPFVLAPTQHLDGIGTAARFTTLGTGIVADNLGNLYLSEDLAYSSIRKIEIATKKVTTVAGNGEISSLGVPDDGIGTNCKVSADGICLDAQGNLMLANYGYIRKLNLSDLKVTTISRNGNAANLPDGNLNVAGFIFPNGIIFKNNKFFVAESYRIRILTLN